MIVFVLQKVFFILFTYPINFSWANVFPIIQHGLKLDIAVTSYVLILPWLILLTDTIKPNKYTSKVLSIYFSIIALIMAICFVADAALYPFWQFKLDSSIFIYTDKPKDAFASVSVGYILWRILLIIIWTLIIVYGTLKSLKRGYIPITHKKTAYVLFALLFPVMFLFIRGGVGEGTNNVSSAYYSNDQYLNHSAVNPVFNFIYSLWKEENFAKQYNFFDEKELLDITKGMYYTDSRNTHKILNTDKPDILFIIWEGCSEQFVGVLGGDSAICPEFDKLSKEGLLFTNFYSNTYRTDRGLVCFNAGWLGLTCHSLMKISKKSEKLPSLTKELNKQGYKTTFWYGGDISFTNMGGYMLSSGFEDVISDKDFTVKERNSKWGVDDQTLFKQLYKKIVTQENDDKPYFNMVMTLSSHEPWDVPTHKLQDPASNAFNYTDRCLGNLLTELSKTDKWENMLVIISADHGAVAGDDYKRYGKKNIHLPLLLLGGALKENGKCDIFMNQSDLAATILGQLNIKHDEFYFSRDVLSESYTNQFATHAYNNGISYIDFTGITTYDNDARKAIQCPDKNKETKAKAILQLTYKKTSRL